MSLSPDVLVIGGGIVGAASAYHLAKRGADVLLLEADGLASGATGRNLGFIWVHTRRVGPELDLVMATRNGLEELPEELGTDFGLRCRGGLIYFTSEAQGAIVREFVERRTADGVPMQLLDGAEARELAPILPDSVLGASFCPLDAQIDPRRYVRAFALAAQRHGARIHEGTAARAITTDGARITRVDTDLGPISAGPGRARRRGVEPARSAGNWDWTCRSTPCASRSSRPSRWPPASSISSTARRP